MAAGPYTDPVLFIKDHGHLCRIHLCNIQSHHRGAFFPGKISVQGNSRNFLYLVIKTPHQLLLSFSDLFCSGFPDPVHGCAKTCDPVAVQGSCLQCLRHILRMLPLKGEDAASAYLQRLHRYPRPNTDGSCALGSHKALMSGKAKNIYMIFFHGNRKYSCCLGSIHNKKLLVLLCDLTDGVDIIEISCQIGSMGTDDHLRLRTDGCFKLRKGDPSLAVCRQDRKLHAFFFQAVQRTEHTVVIHLRTDRMESSLLWMKCSLQGDIERFRVIGCKGHTFRSPYVKHLCDLASCIKNKP